ncbi:hypothetical protein [Alkalihalobacillus sp. BA299]|uniref:hypothetical protein n=1 Tax=Alkalihalobacillus sp. BA299 TaxID=2815938 RepID=UPI001ADD5346|nr:hypothetical protein [Alkalihalobacillus sp. BA299]
MIEYDQKNKQILSSACLSCSDPYFQPGHSSLPTVGCCSYSPIISLFEIHRMVKQNDTDFFINNIYNNPNRTVSEYHIIIHAHVHPRFQRQNTDQLSSIEKADLKLSYSICQFFERKNGCSLLPSYKNATCRSFICSSIEQQLDDHTQKQLLNWTRSIQLETKTFNTYHEKALKSKGLTLKNNVEAVISYLQTVKES